MTTLQPGDAQPRVAEHGTRAMATLHRRRGEPVCEACRLADVEYMRQYRQTYKERRAAAKRIVQLPKELFVRVYWELSPETAAAVDQAMGKTMVDAIIKEVEG